jgi:hypothetical protein
MFAVLVMAMVIGASAVGVRALTANGPGGVARLSGDVQPEWYGAKRANGAISFLRVPKKAYQRAYHCGLDPPKRDRHLGRLADAEVEQPGAAARAMRCLRRGCCWETKGR